MATCDTCGKTGIGPYRTDDATSGPRVECYSCASRRTHWVEANRGISAPPDCRSDGALMDDAAIDDPSLYDDDE